MGRIVAARLVFILSLVAACAAVLVVGPRLAPRSDAWLAVRAPRYVARDSPFTIDVRLAEPSAGSYLSVDLHGYDAAQDRDLGFVAASPSVRIEEGKRDYEFEMAARDLAGLSSVFCVIYVSRDDTWEGRTAAARLDPVAVAESEAAGVRPPLFEVGAYPVAAFYFARPRDLPWLRMAVGAAWAACAALSLLRSRRPESVVFAIACACAAICEMFLLGLGFTNELRDLAKSMGAYVYRKAPQMLLSLSAIALGAVGAVLIVAVALRTGRIARGVARLGLCAYFGVVFLRLVSQHAIDYILTRSIGGAQLGQEARTACAALALGAIVFERLYRRGRRGPVLVEPTSSSGTGSA
jgi:hypothetical protein